MEKNKFKDKVVVITGASAGIGRVTAWEFAKQGAKVVLLARSTEQLEGAKKEVEEWRQSFNHCYRCCRCRPGRSCSRTG